MKHRIVQIQPDGAFRLHQYRQRFIPAPAGRKPVPKRLPPLGSAGEQPSADLAQHTAKHPAPHALALGAATAQ